MQNKKLIALVLSILLLVPALASAEEEFEGNVVAGDTIPVLAPYGGTIQSISLREGALISVGDAVATLQTTKVLAPEDGTVRGIFNEEGDSLNNTTVLYVAPVSKYTISCTIDKAYDAIENKYVRIGETVYIRNKRDGTYKAVGIVTSVDGTKYTVQTTAGELYMEDTVYIYRDEDYTTESRIGSGTVGRTPELAIAGTGSLLKLYVEDGEEVERGQLLFETVEGTLDALGEYSDTIQFDVSGVIDEIKATAGQKVAKGDVLLTVYQQDSYQIEFSIDEDLLNVVNVGDTMNIVFNWKEDSGEAVQGTVTGISYVSEASSTQSGDTTATTTTSSTPKYTGYIAFQADDSVRLGMSVTITTIDE
ncbi:MAG: HlyD family efflux transporter periplasmic adaptor subunit [Eubacteriales bacterium]|nr:HlyD family efflux transporter periplasmic adaptor subunit [Eubacteriales bacterium]